MQVNYITSSLLNSWLYYINHEQASYEDFMAVLKREPREQTEAQAFGCEFEDACYRGEKEAFNQYIDGGLYQIKVCKPYKNIMVLGIIDVLQPDCIYDIKTTRTYDVGKYYHTSQHKVYPYCTGIKNFAYLVNEECFKEDYIYKDGQCEELIEEFLKWLKLTNNYRTWQKLWKKTEKEMEEYELW